MKASFYITNNIRKEKIRERKKRKLSKPGKDFQFSFGKGDKKRKMKNINEEIQYEHPDIP